MFQQLRNEPQFMKQYQRVISTQTAMNQQSRIDSSSSSNKNEEKLVFVDLGSGDGRMVFHAAYREQLFTHCIGYEINPFLHAYAVVKQQLYKYLSLFFPHQYPTGSTNPSNAMTTPTSTAIPSPRIASIQTEFHLRDLWNVDLKNVHVVAVVCIFM